MGTLKKIKKICKSSSYGVDCFTCILGDEYTGKCLVGSSPMYWDISKIKKVLKKLEAEELKEAKK